jgi:hypothetical protein
VIPVRVGDVELLLETTPVAGTEPTSKLDEAGERVASAFVRAQAAIVEIATSTVDVIKQTTERAARPDHVEVEFGLKFSAQGNVIVAGAAGEATLLVTLSYDGKREEMS